MHELYIRGHESGAARGAGGGGGARGLQAFFLIPPSLVADFFRFPARGKPRYPATDGEARHVAAVRSASIMPDDYSARTLQRVLIPKMRY